MKNKVKVNYFKTSPVNQQIINKHITISNHNYNLPNNLKISHFVFPQFHQDHQIHQKYQKYQDSLNHNLSSSNRYNTKYNYNKSLFIKQNQHKYHFHKNIVDQSENLKIYHSKAQRAKSAILLNNKKTKTIQNIKYQSLQKQVLSKNKHKNTNYEKKYKRDYQFYDKIQLSARNQIGLSQIQYKYFKQQLQKSLTLQDLNQYQNQSFIRDKSLNVKIRPLLLKNSHSKKRPFSSFNYNYQQNIRKKSQKTIILSSSNPQNKDSLKNQFKLLITARQALKKIPNNQSLRFGQIEHIYFVSVNNKKFSSKPLKTIKNKLKFLKYQKNYQYDQTKAIIGSKIL